MVTATKTGAAAGTKTGAAGTAGAAGKTVTARDVAETVTDPELPMLTLADLGVLQRELLTSALAAVRPGGVVTYVTCSPHLAETRLVVEDVLKRTGDGQVLDAVEIAAEVTTTPLTDQRGPYLQLWPHRHGTDAMFCAVIRRSEQ